MNILITGGTGYIGGKLIRRLSEEGHRIYAVVRKTSHTENIEPYVEGLIDVGHLDAFYEQVRESHPQVLIQLMGFYTAVHDPHSLRELMNDNIVDAMTVVDAAVAAGVKRIIATASVQQQRDGKEPLPINAYGASRNAFERMLCDFGHLYDLSVTVLTLFDTYGADDQRRKVFNLVRRLKEHESIDMSAGEQKMYLLYIDDVVEGYLCALHQSVLKNCFEKFALRAKEPIRLRDFVERYLELSGKEVVIHWGARPYMALEIMDPTGFGEVLPGWGAKVSYEEGLALCAQADRSLENIEKAQ
ncbi:MAG: NAD(P)-dependent oxidoreductase [Lachnospiraceae bacterium]|nr:NAD(P)-dependent oxidoreductase [Lachnospiraceae bacterium]